MPDPVVHLPLLKCFMMDVTKPKISPKKTFVGLPGILGKLPIPILGELLYSSFPKIV